MQTHPQRVANHFQSEQRVRGLLGLRPEHLHARIAVTVAMHLHELRDVELGLLNDLHLPDERILKRLDALGLLLELLAN